MTPDEQRQLRQTIQAAHDATTALHELTEHWSINLAHLLDLRHSHLDHEARLTHLETRLTQLERRQR